MQYADEVIVVINLEPRKASNGMEGKTQGTTFSVTAAVMGQKHMTDAKDGRGFKVHSKTQEAVVKVLNDS